MIVSEGAVPSDEGHSRANCEAVRKLASSIGEPIGIARGFGVVFVPQEEHSLDPQQRTEALGSAQTRGFLQRLCNRLSPLQSQQLLAARGPPISTWEFFILRILKMNNYLGALRPSEEPQNAQFCSHSLIPLQMLLWRPRQRHFAQAEADPRSSRTHGSSWERSDRGISAAVVQSAAATAVPAAFGCPGASDFHLGVFHFKDP